MLNWELSGAAPISFTAGLSPRGRPIDPFKSSESLLTPMSWETDRVLVLGHRGYSALYPENTLLAFEEAVRAGADGVELDVRLTLDGEAVVIHDESLDRTSDMSGLVSELTLPEIRRADLGMDQRIPALEEVLSEVEGLVNVEIKEERAVDRCVRVVRETDSSERVLYSSFNVNILRRVRSMDSEARLGLLIDSDEVLAEIPSLAADLGLFSVNASVEGVDLLGVEGFAAASEMLRRSGLRLILWALSDDRLHQLLPELAGTFDAVITDDPPRALRLLTSMGLR